MSREKQELFVLSWNVQKEWDVILLQELSFKDELLSLEELEASFGEAQIGDEPEMSVGHGHHH